MEADYYIAQKLASESNSYTCLLYTSQTTEKYLGGEQDIANAVNDRIFARVKKFQSNSE